MTSRAIFALALGLALLAARPAAAAAPKPIVPRCPNPTAGQDWQQRSPSELGFDAAALDRALDQSARRKTSAIAVYRFGCRAGARYTQPAATRQQSWSVAKSITSMLVGRAWELGILSPADRVGGLIPEADPAHGAVTLRQLLTMTSGAHQNHFRDYNATGLDDVVRNWLTLAFDRAPGTFFEYLQVGVSVAAEMVTRAARTPDLKAFADRELFGPLGIPTAEWQWQRDRSGKVAGYYGVLMRESHFARLGQLMLQDGMWSGRRLLPRQYVKEAQAPTETNPAYGLLFWTNRGDTLINPTVEKRDVLKGGLLPGAPKDLYGMYGLFGQRVIMIPSLGLVITRFGLPAGSNPLALASAEDADHALVGSIVDALRSPDPPPTPPYVSRQSSEDFDPDYGILEALTEPDQFGGLLQTLPPLPPAGPRRARAVLVRTLTPRATRDGRVPVRLLCPPFADRACEGPLSLQTPGGARRARGAYSISPGATATVVLRAKSVLRRELATERGLRKGLLLELHSRSADMVDGTPNAELLRVLAPRQRG